MTWPEEQVDCVKLMREIRDRLSAQFSDMSFEEERRYLDDHVSLPPHSRGERNDLKRTP